MTRLLPSLQRIIYLLLQRYRLKARTTQPPTPLLLCPMLPHKRSGLLLARVRRTQLLTMQTSTQSRGKGEQSLLPISKLPLWKLAQLLSLLIIQSSQTVPVIHLEMISLSILMLMRLILKLPQLSLLPTLMEWIREPLSLMSTTMPSSRLQSKPTSRLCHVKMVSRQLK
ncbi:hypothetical protein F5Y15DRAFT_400712 [Xylariaceae sp. FL0016]|nr:hypothetical protein F5Y15DRAFT_400712 [Xylariaceae sp. FL0016]